jgi:NADH dehydrogenase [ubiquinone] 1 alpha subcomplex assembly factor 7
VTPLAALLRRRIHESGPLSVADYMTDALGHGEHGYYVKRDPFGASGDFMTAPEISQVFGELIGAWCVEVWRTMDAPDPVRVVELGPGRGTLLADAARVWRHSACGLSDGARLHLVETSPALRARQQTALAATWPEQPATWHSRLAEVPEGPMILLANEFFDALPIHQYVLREGAWRERLVDVTAETDGFAFVEGLDAAIAEGEDELVGIESDVRELCPAGEALAAEIGARVAAHGGAALIIDYGTSRSALGDTLQAVRGHRHADPLADPGEADLSHHVDFHRLRQAAQRAGATTFGPIPQGLLLGRLGIGARVEALANAASSPERAEAIRGAVRRLIHPGRMGVLFKAFAIADPALPTPPGFASHRA